MRLGIDFGTTRTVVAACDRGNYPIVSFESGDGVPCDWYPSMVAEVKGKLVFGTDALLALDDPAAPVVRSFKRLLTDTEASAYTEVQIGATRTSLVELITSFFLSLRRDISERSNIPVRIAPQDKVEVVVATPANAHNTQRFVTLEAFRRAGFEVVAILNEPSAAGLEYAHRYRRTINSKRELVLVYDLGGGTFDASLVKMRGRAHDVLATSGVNQLGGDDFDRRLMELVLEERGIVSLGVSDATVTRLLEHCREQKERLRANSRRISVELGRCLSEEERTVNGLNIDENVSISTARYYEACAPLVEMSLEALGRAVALCPETNDNLDRVAGIYVVGGGSALPVVARTLRDTFGRRVHRSAYPSGSTAIGLAIAGDPDAGFEITERLTRHFGVFREERDGAQVGFDLIFSKGLEIPEAGEEPVVFERNYRAKHNIGHFRYVECGRLDENGAPRGDITPFAEVLFPFDPQLRAVDELRAVRVKRLPSEGALIRESYSVNAAGVTELTIADLDNDFVLSHRFSSP